MVFFENMGDRLMVGQQPLELFIMVRIHVPQLIRLAALAHSYSSERIILSEEHSDESKNIYVLLLHSPL
jgi:hypothetical protein